VLVRVRADEVVRRHQPGHRARETVCAAHGRRELEAPPVGRRARVRHGRLHGVGAAVLEVRLHEDVRHVRGGEGEPRSQALGGPSVHGDDRRLAPARHVAARHHEVNEVRARGHLDPAVGVVGQDRHARGRAGAARDPVAASLDDRHGRDRGNLPRGAGARQASRAASGGRWAGLEQSPAPARTASRTSCVTIESTQEVMATCLAALPPRGRPRGLAACPPRPDGSAASDGPARAPGTGRRIEGWPPRPGEPDGPSPGGPRGRAARPTRPAMVGQTERSLIHRPEDPTAAPRALTVARASAHGPQGSARYARAPPGLDSACAPRQPRGRGGGLDGGGAGARRPPGGPSGAPGRRAAAGGGKPMMRRDVGP
jgi:hypothetical protein